MITRILDGQTVTIEIDGKTVGTVRPRHVPSNGGGEWSHWPWRHLPDPGRRRGLGHRVGEGGVMSVRGWFYTGYLALLAALVFLAVSCSSATNGGTTNGPMHVFDVQLDNGRTLQCISSDSYSDHGILDCDWGAK